VSIFRVPCKGGSPLAYRDLTNRIIGLAIEVYRTIGRGLLEYVYAACLCDELAQAGMPFQRQAGVPVMYRGARDV
jgi:GxxExxY protein